MLNWVVVEFDNVEEEIDVNLMVLLASFVEVLMDYGGFDEDYYR
jgi:hypothetical protein